MDNSEIYHRPNNGWYWKPQQARLLASIEGIDDESLHNALLGNMIRKYEEASRQFETLFRGEEYDGMDLNQLFEELDVQAD